MEKSFVVVPCYVVISWQVRKFQYRLTVRLSECVRLYIYKVLNLIVSSHRNLGIIVSSNMSWTTHCNQILNEAYRSLGLLRHFFRVHAKKILYLSLVRSKVTYCSQIWHPYLLKNIIVFERLQRRATKFILNNYTDDYKQRLTNLKLLPLLYQFDYYDISFLINSIKNPNPSFNIHDYISFCSGGTRSSSHNKLQTSYSPRNYIMNFYFIRLPRLWNFLPTIDLSLPANVILNRVRDILWQHFIEHFNPDNPRTYHYFCPCTKCCYNAPNVNFSQVLNL